MVASEERVTRARVQILVIFVVLPPFLHILQFCFQLRFRLIPHLQDIEMP